jgi:hypothetical protein
MLLKTSASEPALNAAQGCPCGYSYRETVANNSERSNDWKR